VDRRDLYALAVLGPVRECLAETGIQERCWRWLFPPSAGLPDGLHDVDPSQFLLVDPAHQVLGVLLAVDGLPLTLAVEVDGYTP